LRKDSDYIYRYHAGQLQVPGGGAIASTFDTVRVAARNLTERSYCKIPLMV
jgi:hypothetical protein